MKYIALLGPILLYPTATYADTTQVSPVIDYVERSLNNTVVVREKGRGSYSVPNDNAGPRVVQEQDLYGHQHECHPDCRYDHPASKMR